MQILTAWKQKSKGVKYEVGDIFRAHLDEYRQEHKMSYEQTRAAIAIMKCRTPALGGHLRVCNQCGKWAFSYKSCKNRHCPKCGSFEKAQWLERQMVWMLPIPYFHVVFTIDHVFNPLVWRNQEAMYNLLIHTAAETLKQSGQRYLGGELGFTMVLHTWGQQLQRHLHGHCIVTGGALVSTKDGYRWQAAQHKFLFPAELFSKDFRQAFCQGVRRLWQQGQLDTADESLDVAAMLTEAQGKKWDLYIQPPPCGVANLKDYLGRYVYGIAISNHRILECRDGQVTFEYYDNRDQGKLKTKTVSAVEFIRLFLMHVLPRSFPRIRHFGLHHGSCRAKLQQARKLLGLPSELPVILKLKLIDWLMMILETEEDPRLCPDCRQGLLLSVREFGPISKGRLQMLTFLGLFSRWMFAPAL